MDSRRRTYRRTTCLTTVALILQQYIRYVTAACAIDATACLDQRIFVFSTCKWTAKQGECSEKGATPLVTGLFDVPTMKLQTDKKDLDFTYECGKVSIPGLGLFGNVNVADYNDGRGLQCQAIYGAVMVSQPWYCFLTGR